VSLGIISQRPSELEPSTLSQCSTIFSMRLSNELDQNFVRAAVPDGAAELLSFLPSLGRVRLSAKHNKLKGKRGEVFRGRHNPSLRHGLPGRIRHCQLVKLALWRPKLEIVSRSAQIRLKGSRNPSLMLNQC